jgi:hypothetical protein
MNEKSMVQLRVWWIPQVPGKPFIVPVASLDEGKRIMEILANYDAFQYANRIKGDYCNMGGMSWKHPALTGNEWYDLDPKFPDDIEEVQTAMGLLGLEWDDPS